MKVKIIRNSSYTELEMRINEIEEDCDIIDIKFIVHTEASMATGESMVIYYALILYN